jgi:hypothetical protein
MVLLEKRPLYSLQSQKQQLVVFSDSILAARITSLVDVSYFNNRLVAGLPF